MDRKHSYMSRCVAAGTTLLALMLTAFLFLSAAASAQEALPVP
jgi:hypothetical protein